jgi:hypothetical protein
MIKSNRITKESEVAEDECAVAENDVGEKDDDEQSQQRSEPAWRKPFVNGREKLRLSWAGRIGTHRARLWQNEG